MKVLALIALLAAPAWATKTCEFPARIHQTSVIVKVKLTGVDSYALRATGAGVNMKAKGRLERRPNQMAKFQIDYATVEVWAKEESPDTFRLVWTNGDFWSDGVCRFR